MGDQPSKIEYIVDTKSWWWLSTEWMSILVILGFVLDGSIATGFFYLGYVILKEIIMSFPFNYMEYIAGNVPEDELIWPILTPRGPIGTVEGERPYTVNRY